VIDRQQLAGLVDERVIPPPAETHLGSPTRTTHVADHDRVLGALVGCAAGDALGGPNEGRGAHCGGLACHTPSIACCPRPAGDERWLPRVEPLRSLPHQ